MWLDQSRSLGGEQRRCIYSSISLLRSQNVSKERYSKISSLVNVLDILILFLVVAV